MSDTERPTARHREAGSDIEMVAFAERVRTATRTVPVRRVRVQRVVVTERRTIEVDVRHEEVRLVEEDLLPDASTGSDGTPERSTPWVVLRSEQIEVVRTLRADERVRLVVDAVEGEATLATEVRREVIDVEQDVPSTSR